MNILQKAVAYAAVGAAVAAVPNAYAEKTMKWESIGTVRFTEKAPAVRYEGQVTKQDPFSNWGLLQQQTQREAELGLTSITDRLLKAGATGPEVQSLAGVVEYNSSTGGMSKPDAFLALMNKYPAAFNNVQVKNGVISFTQQSFSYTAWSPVKAGASMLVFKYAVDKLGGKTATGATGGCVIVTPSGSIIPC